ncbi:MAG: chloride channel protein [Solirubrobacteraceae bacterium]|nr:chloride channel protein [Solirubrobacteraceae bacterium]
MTDAPPPELTADQADEMIASRPFVGLLVLAGIVGFVVSFAAWLFLEGTYQLQQLLFDELPGSLGQDGDPALWYLVIVLAIAGLIVAFAVARLPGNGGHVPAHGLAGGDPTQPVDLPGVMLAAVASIGFGVVLGPEAPLIALGTGLAIYTVHLTRREVPPQAMLIIAAGGSFAALSFIFESPIIAAVILIEATGLGGAQQRLVLLPGLLAAGLGSLVSIGIGSVTGLNTSDYALGPLPLPKFAEPTVPDFLWAVVLAIVVALAVQLMLRLGRETERLATPRPFVVLPVIGVVIAVLAFVFGAATDESSVTVLLSGQDALPGLVSGAGDWPVATLLLLIACKGIAYALSLGSFRGGPTFPALFLGAAAGILAAELPGFSTTPAVAVGMAAATVAVLRLPLSAAVLGILLTAEAGAGASPLVIVGVVVAMVVTLRFSQRVEPAT